MDVARAGTTLLIEQFFAQTCEYAIICIDPQGKITAWLGAAALIFGYDEDDVIGQDIAILFTRDDVAKGLNAHELDVASRDSRSQDDRWHVRADGTRIWITGSVQAVRDNTGELVGFVKVARDRTDLQARIEHQQQQFAGGDAAGKRTHAFLRTLGHELRNPLTPLVNGAFILRRVSQDANVLKVADIIDSQTAVLRRMADDLVDVARLDIGRVQLQLQRTDLRDLLHDTCVGFQQTANAKGVRLQSILPTGALLADVDRQRVEQVIQNLLTNAIRYTPAGGDVWIKATQEESDIVVRVEDTGVGIAAEMLPKLFDLFTRDAAAEKIEPSGLGVGLAVVKAVMELHAGSAQARSPGAGKGSEFTVRFRAADHPRQAG